MKKAQKNLHNFFPIQKREEAEVTCSACGDKYPSSKVNWHRDFDCKVLKCFTGDKPKSVSHSKSKKSRKSKIVKCSNNSKAKLSDSESEIIILSDSDSECYSTGSTVSPDRKRPVSPALFDLEEKNCDKENKILNIEGESLIDALKNDWSSPQDTPVKLEEKEPCHTPKRSQSNLGKKNLEREISEKLNKNISIGNSEFSHIGNDTNSRDEFENDNIIFNSPLNLRLKKERNKLPKKSPKNMKGVENSSLPLLTPKSPSRSLPDSSSEIQPLHCVEVMYGDGSNCSFEENSINSPMLVSPERTPTPSPDISLSREDFIKNTFGASPKILMSPQSLNESSQSGIVAKGSSYKKTPKCILRSLQKTTLQNSYISPSLIKVRRNLYPSNEHEDSSESSPVKVTPKHSPYKYRNDKGMYLENFLHIIDVVTSQPEDLELFNKEDLRAIKGFHSLTLQAQKLYVRLFQRKLKWNRVSKLEYKEICDKEDIFLYVNELVYSVYLFSEDKLTNLKELLFLLDVSEIRKLCKDMKIPTAGNKDNLVSKLMKCERQQKSLMSSFTKTENDTSRIFKLAKEAVGKSYLINEEVWNVFMRILLVYSPVRFEEDEAGQQTQLKTLLMVSIGRMKFPPYELSRKHTLYRSRDDLLRFQDCLQLECDIQECLKNQEWEEAVKLCKRAAKISSEIQSDQETMNHDKLLPPFLRQFTTMSLLYHIRTLAVEAFQRLKQYGKAVSQLEQLLDQKTYLQDYRGRWYDRLALNLHPHLKRAKKCLEVIKEALRDPEVRVGHRLSLSQRAERLCSSKGAQQLVQDFEGQLQFMTFQEAPKVFIKGKSFPSDIPGYKRVFISSGDDNEGDKMCSVEELVLDFYKKEGYPEGLHCESRTVAGLFGLFMWKILYLPIPDAFRSPHQGAPLDLDSPHFYSSRKKEIDKRLKRMEKWSLEEANVKIERIWNENENLVCIIDWKMFSSLEFVQGLVAGLGMKLIAAICRRLAEDHRFTRSGFPDLVVWNPLEKKSRIVEVKGPNDRLSTKQILWLDFLLQHGASAEVCHVEAVGQKRTGPLKIRRESARKREKSDLDLQGPSYREELSQDGNEGRSRRGTKRKLKN